MAGPKQKGALGSILPAVCNLWTLLQGTAGAAEVVRVALQPEDKVNMLEPVSVQRCTVTCWRPPGQKLDLAFSESDDAFLA